MRVDGAGNYSARILFVSDTPTEFEGKVGRPMIGNAGDEFDAWLWRTCRLTRDDVWITVLQREFSKKDRDATPAEIEDFWAEVAGVGPDLICPLGNESLRGVLGEWASMDLCAGLLHESHVRGNPVKVLPFPHPGGVNYIGMTQGFEALARYLSGRLPVHQVDDKPVSYCEMTDSNYVYLAPHDIVRPGDVLAIDTEGSVERPWCLTLSGYERGAMLIRATSRDALQWFRTIIEHECPTVVMHYAPHDLRVLDAMGVHIDCSKVRVLDTMQLAYISGRMPQGLKTLAYRLCGMRMGEYMDLVQPFDDALVLDYLRLLELVFGPSHPKDKKHPVYKAVQRCLKSKRGPRALWLDQQPPILDAALEAVGPMEAATLDHVPFEKVLPYACADADGTRRVFFKLRELFD